ncbi:hypothetical protein [Anatilimnocola floriformis]|uniref:hypothetical protein n=1 Tax=Anatilimnocola floriformis TaxID=2948575 RepID=UPI0020C45E46|nr:hypothetical protein [Anatilimnocola floriformis]
MIVLVTTAPEVMYQPEGVGQAFDGLRSDVLKLLAKLAEDSDSRIIVFDRKNAVALGDSGKFVSERAEAIYSDRLGVEAVSAAHFVDAVEAYCGVQSRCQFVASIQDADFFFNPRQELGTFSRRIDESPDVIHQLNLLGEYLGALDGDLLICVALSQSPDRIAEFVSESGWSWVRHRGGQFQLVRGPMPKAFEACGQMTPESPDIEWSQAMTVEQLANRIGVHRNTMRDYLKKQKIPNRKLGSLYQVPSDRLHKR